MAYMQIRNPSEEMQKRYDGLYEAAAKIIKDQHAAGNQTLEIKVELPKEYDSDMLLEETVTITFKKPVRSSLRKEENVWTL
jgi:hypothetical protein